MSQQREKIFYALLPVVLALLGVLYFLYATPHQAGKITSVFEPVSAPAQTAPVPEETWQSSELFEQEMLAVAPNSTPVSRPAYERSQRHLSYRPIVPAVQAPRTSSAALVNRPTVASAAKARGTAAPSKTSFSSGPSNTKYTANTTGNYTAPANALYTSAQNQQLNHQRSYNTLPNPSNTQQTAESIWAEYTPKQTYKEQKALEGKLNNMSSAIERAITQAMLPKSKRNQNIEKYLNRRSGTAPAQTNVGAEKGGASTPAPVTPQQQIASQASGIVSDIQKNYGDDAAAKAQDIMSDFEQEMAAAFDPNGDPQENALRAKAVNHKYNEKLRKLNQEESMRKMEAEWRAKNEEKLAEIGRKFNPQTQAAAREKMEANLQERMKIMRTPQSEEDMYRQILALEEKERKELETVVKEKNPTDLTAVAKLHELENEQAKEQILQAEREEKEGRQTQQNFQVNEQSLAEMNKSWEKESQEIINSLAAYGPEVQAQAKDILDQMRAERSQIMAQGGTVNEVNRQNMEITDQANERLKNLREQNKAVFIQNVEADMNARNQEVLASYTQQMTGSSEETKAQWSTQAEKVLQKYNRLRAQLAADAQNNPNYSKDMQTLSKQEYAELAAIEVAAPRP